MTGPSAPAFGVTYHAVIVKKNDQMYTMIWRVIINNVAGPVTMTSYGLIPKWAAGSTVVCVTKTAMGSLAESDPVSLSDGYAWLADRIKEWEQYTHLCPGGFGVPCSGPVTYGPDPYEHEINGDDTPHWICEGHRYESAQEI